MLIDNAHSAAGEFIRRHTQSFAIWPKVDSSLALMIEATDCIAALPWSERE